MKTTTDERRALAFISAVLFLSAGVRLSLLPDPVDPPSDGFDIAAHVEATKAAVAAAERAAQPLGADERIDPNSADAAELDRLPGIGPAVAARIVADRAENGPYRVVADLDRVTGIGASMLEKLRPHIDLRDAPAGDRYARAWERATATTMDRAVARPPRGSGAATARAPSSSPETLVDPNTADTIALRTLPGIGPALAARIVAYRDSAGPFRSPEDLLAVRGIGPATLARFRDRLRLDGR